MKIRILANGKSKVSAIADADGKCPVYNDLMGNLSDQYKRYGIILLDKIDRISNEGFQSFSSKLAHEICKEPKVYELIQGKLRLIFFHGKEEMVAVCTEIIIKQGQKADKKAVNRAIKASNAYWQSLDNGSLNLIEEGKNGAE